MASLRTHFCFLKRFCAVVLECVKAGDTEYMAMVLSTQLFDRINMGRTEIYALFGVFMTIYRKSVENIRSEVTHF